MSNRPIVPRLVVFTAVISVVVLAVNGFVWSTWQHFSGHPAPTLWPALSTLVALAFIPITILGFRYSNRPLRWAYTVAAVWLGLLNYGFFAAVAVRVLSGASRLALGHPLRPDWARGVFALGLLIAAWGLVNAAWLRVTRITISLPNLPEAWDSRTIALVTDIHLGHVSGPKLVRRIVRRLRALQPAAVLIGGDLFDGTTAGLAALVADWTGYAPPRGIFYVTGNHDEFAPRQLYLDAVRPTGIRVIDNEKIEVDGLQLIGVHDTEAGDPAALRAILRQARIDPQRASILLAHQPAHLDVAQAEGISLQLSGHTHRGQTWPWNHVVALVWGPFAYGLARLGALQVYTSSGVGTWGPPLRVGTKSELVLIRLLRGGEFHPKTRA